MLLGLSGAAWVIVLQALMTATSILSAWCFAVPVMRSQGLDFSVETLRGVETGNAEVQSLVKQAADKLEMEKQRSTPKAIGYNKAVWVLLAVSAMIFIGALTLQICTDRAFGTAG